MIYGEKTIYPKAMAMSTMKGLDTYMNSPYGTGPLVAGCVFASIATLFVSLRFVLRYMARIKLG